MGHEMKVKTKRGKPQIDVAVLLEHIGGDGELLVETIKTLTAVARTTCDSNEKAQICAALEKLCGPSSDPDPTLSKEHV